MSEESVTPNLVEHWQDASEAASRRDFDAMMTFFAPGAVGEAQALGISVESFEGGAAIRRFIEDWIDAYEEYESEIVESQTLGNGVVLAVNSQNARPLGSPVTMQERLAFTVVSAAGMIVRVMVSRDIDQARAAAERLAEARG
jgi:hypothetical protein